MVYEVPKRVETKYFQVLISSDWIGKIRPLYSRGQPVLCLSISFSTTARRASHEFTSVKSFRQSNLALETEATEFWVPARMTSNGVVNSKNRPIESEIEVKWKLAEA